MAGNFDFAAARATASDAVDSVAHLPPEYRPALAAVVLNRALGNGLSIGSQRAAQEQRSLAAPSAAATIAVAGATVGETLARIGKRTQQEQLVAIAVHRLTVDAIAELTREQFLQSYAEIRMPPPQNVSEQIGRAVRRGWLGQTTNAEGKRAWRVTQTGLRAAEDWMAQ